MKHLNWDNLRYVLMVANQGSISAAARELGVNRSTVLRRIEQFQDDLNCRIFNRSVNGYALTAEAEKMIDAAREVEATLFDMQRQLEGAEMRLEGKLRVTTTDSFMVGLLGEPLARFRDRHPHIVLELVITNRILNLARHDADIAIRPAQVPEAGFISHQLCEVPFYIYRHQSSAITKNWQADDWIGVTDALLASPVGGWFDQHLNPDRIVIRCDSLVSARTCAEAGMGLVLLPEALGDASPNLQKLEDTSAQLQTGLWLLTHPDLVRSARVNAFVEHLSETLGRAS